MQSAKVLIVGSGPAGLVLALSLLKNGIPVRIIEKDAQHHNGERGPGIMPRTLEIEQFLGVSDEVRKAGTGLPTIHIFDPEDPHKYRVVLSSKLPTDVEPTPAFPITKPMLIGQWRHQAILRRHVEALGRKVELGSEFIGCTQDENGVATEVRKVVDGVEHIEKARFEYLVGADGGRSTVRKVMGVNFLGETREEERMHVFDARVEGLDVDSNIRIWGNQKTATVSLRQTTEPGLFQVVFAGPEARHDFLKAHNDPQAIQDELHRITNRTDLRVTGINWNGEWRPNIRMADHFQVGRVFIIGDAAHTHSPTGGQGLNSSVQDAFNLAWKLALSIKGIASPSLLESYEKERLPVIAEMLKISTILLDRQIQSGIEAPKEEPHKTPKDGAWIRDRRLLQLDIHCRWSPVVVDERFPQPNLGPLNAYGAMTGETRAGDRAPDAPGLLGANAPNRLFDIFNPAMHTLLLFVADQVLIEQASAIIALFSLVDPGLIQKVLVLPAGTDASNISASLSDAKHVIMDSEGHAFTNYGMDPSDDSPTVVVVRPDAMIGAFLKTVAGTRKYLSSVFQMNP